MDSIILNTSAPKVGAKPTQFQFTIDKFPNTTFLVQNVAVPQVGFGTAVFATPLQDIKYPGEKLSYADLEVEFLLDENIQNYIEIHAWMRNLSMTYSRDAYSEFIKRRSDASKFSSGSRLVEETTTAVLTALNQQNQPSFQFLFHDIFPVAMSSLDFSTTSDDMEFMKCRVTFSYNSFDVGLAIDSVISENTDGISELGLGKFNINL